jgi:hypothetical protein
MPTLLVMLAMTALLAEMHFRRAPASAGFPLTRIPGVRFRPQQDLISTRLIVCLLATIGVAALTGIAARAVAQANNSPLVNGVMFTGSGVALLLALWTWRWLTPWNATQIEVQSERWVGRELNLLMLDGCRVFHDLVHDDIGQIDHIVVAPHALFMVETHTVKPSLSDAANTVVYNGQELRFAKRKTRKLVETTAAKARWLSGHLEQRTGICLPVHPILALPGWQVQTTTRGEVRVVNPEELSSIVVDKAAEPLYEAQRRKIINFLDGRCQYAPF